MPQSVLLAAQVSSAHGFPDLVACLLCKRPVHECLGSSAASAEVIALGMVTVNVSHSLRGIPKAMGCFYRSQAGRLSVHSPLPVWYAQIPDEPCTPGTLAAKKACDETGDRLKCCQALASPRWACKLEMADTSVDVQRGKCLHLVHSMASLVWIRSSSGSLEVVRQSASSCS